MNYTILDASNEFAELSNNIGIFKIELCKELSIDFESDDFRLLTLDTIQQYLLSLTSYIRAFVDLQIKVNNPDEFLKILNVGLTKEQMEKIVYGFPIISLITMVHFQIDSFFGEICELKGKSQTGFYNRMMEVLDGIKIEDEEKKNYQNTLQCLAFFRNSFHNKGSHSIHRKKWKNGEEPKKGEIDRVFESKGLKIEFKHKELIVYNWKSAYLLVKESVETLYLLIKKLYLTEQTRDS